MIVASHSTQQDIWTLYTSLAMCSINSDEMQIVGESGIIWMYIYIKSKVILKLIW